MTTTPDLYVKVRDPGTVTEYRKASPADLLAAGFVAKAELDAARSAFLSTLTHPPLLERSAELVRRTMQAVDATDSEAFESVCADMREWLKDEATADRADDAKAAEGEVERCPRCHYTAKQWETRKHYQRCADPFHGKPVCEKCGSIDTMCSTLGCLTKEEQATTESQPPAGSSPALVNCGTLLLRERNYHHEDCQVCDALAGMPCHDQHGDRVPHMLDPKRLKAGDPAGGGGSGKFSEYPASGACHLCQAPVNVGNHICTDSTDPPTGGPERVTPALSALWGALQALPDTTEAARAIVAYHRVRDEWEQSEREAATLAARLETERASSLANTAELVRADEAIGALRAEVAELKQKLEAYEGQPIAHYVAKSLESDAACRLARDMRDQYMAERDDAQRKVAELKAERDGRQQLINETIEFCKEHPDSSARTVGARLEVLRDVSSNVNRVGQVDAATFAHLVADELESKAGK